MQVWPYHGQHDLINLMQSVRLAAGPTSFSQSKTSSTARPMVFPPLLVLMAASRTPQKHEQVGYNPATSGCWTMLSCILLNSDTKKIHSKELLCNQLPVYWYIYIYFNYLYHNFNTSSVAVSSGLAAVALVQRHLAAEPCKVKHCIVTSHLQSKPQTGLLFGRSLRPFSSWVLLVWRPNQAMIFLCTTLCGCHSEFLQYNCTSCSKQHTCSWFRESTKLTCFFITGPSTLVWPNST